MHQRPSPTRDSEWTTAGSRHPAPPAPRRVGHPSRRFPPRPRPHRQRANEPPADVEERDSRRRRPPAGGTPAAPDARVGNAAEGGVVRVRRAAPPPPRPRAQQDRHAVVLLVGHGQSAGRRG
jgi:hypothetical protein